MKRTLGLGSGLVGAASVTLLNYLGKRYFPWAPQLDILGLRLVTAAFSKAGIEPPKAFPLKLFALIADLISNSIFYGLVGLGKSRTAWLRGVALGLAMGVGAVALPTTLGVGDDTTGRTPMSKAGTILWYVLGGFLAAFAFAASHRNTQGGRR